MRKPLSPLLVCILLCGCPGLLGPEVVPEAKGDFNPSGEISFLNTGASFDGSRVRNPRCNLSKRTDGSWGGLLDDQAIDVSVTPKAIRGVNFVLSLEQQDEKGTVIVGQWEGRIMRFEIHPDEIKVRTETHSFTLGRSGPNSFGNKGELIMKGEASLALPPWPQIAFAMLAAFE